MKTKMYFLILMFVPMLVLGQLSQPEFTGVQKTDNSSDKEIVNLLIEYLTKNFICPDGSTNCIPEGTAVVKFVVTADGEVTDVEVVNSLCCIIDDELIRALESTDGMWKPAESNGVPISKTKEVSLMYVTNQNEDNPKDYFEKNAIRYYNKGNKHLFEMNNPKKAIKYYDRSISYRPNEASPLLLRGLCKYEIGDEEGACSDWNRINNLGKANVDEYLDKLCGMKGYEEMVSIIDE